jgi:hypothetical protein
MSQLSSRHDRYPIHVPLFLSLHFRVVTSRLTRSGENAHLAVSSYGSGLRHDLLKDSLVLHIVAQHYGVDVWG